MSDKDNDPDGGPFMTRIMCLQIHKTLERKLEHRLTRLEVLTSIEIATFIGGLLALWRMMGGH